MEDVEQTGSLKLILAWSVAGFPLLEGVIQTLLFAMMLFQ